MTLLGSHIGLYGRFKNFIEPFPQNHFTICHLLVIRFTSLLTYLKQLSKEERLVVNRFFRLGLPTKKAMGKRPKISDVRLACIKHIA